jgi:hypothetical protein
MVSPVMRLANSARIGLAAIRLFNGGVALVAPEAMARRLGAGPEPSSQTIYALRLFGIALVVHLADTAAAVLGARRGLPAGTARTLTVVSGTNSVLAALARRA